MKGLLNELGDKYQIQLDTIRELINTTNSDDESHEIAKYKAVHRFIQNFINDIDNLKDYLEEENED